MKWGLGASKWMLGASLLVPLALLAGVASFDRAAVLRHAEQEVGDTADVFEENAQSVFKTHELIARAIDEQLGPMSWDEIGVSRSLHEYLMRFKAQAPLVLGVWLVDPLGRLRNSARAFPVPALDVSDREYFVALHERYSGTASHAVSIRVTAEGSLSLALPRSSTNNEFNGVIVVSVSPDYFIDFWRKTAPPLGMMAGLLGSDLNILVREPASQSDTISSGSAVASAIRQSDRASVRTVSVVDGVERLMAFRRVGAYDVYVVHGVGVNAALGLWYQHLAVYASFFALAAAALFLIAMRAIAEGERRRVAEVQLRQAEKMKAIGQLTSQFAHDFGNILMGILLNLEPLRGGSDDVKQLNDGVQLALAAAQQGEKTVRSMLAFARREPLESAVIEVGAALARIEILMRQALGSTSRLVIAIPPDTWPIKAEPVQLERAVLNLAINARDAMPKGGTMRIAASNVRANGAPNGIKGNFVALSVSDTGAGIPPELASKVFEPFFTTKEEGKGTGLGLSQVYDFAKACGGTVTVDSTPALGATVSIYLPCAVEAATETKEPAETAIDSGEKLGQTPRAILVVEDEEHIRHMVAKVLRERGYVVFEAATGDEALATLPSHPEIDMIFTDVRMPGRHDGISMVAEARRTRPDLKIVFATGYSGGGLRDSAGATILQKPYRAREILEAVDQEHVD
jgi:signal transduction histidine kinase/CheY-like chemotaxis protein